MEHERTSKYKNLRGYCLLDVVLKVGATQVPLSPVPLRLSLHYYLVFHPQFCCICIRYKLRPSWYTRRHLSNMHSSWHTFVAKQQTWRLQSQHHIRCKAVDMYILVIYENSKTTKARASYVSTSFSSDSFTGCLLSTGVASKKWRRLHLQRFLACHSASRRAILIKLLSSPFNLKVVC